MLILSILLGLCLGSFFHVIVSRNNLSWVKGRSKCDMCETTLKWYELIPVVSFILQKGKCKHCGNKISSKHLISELIMGAVGITAFFCINTFEPFTATTIVITLIVIGFESISDVSNMQTYTLPIYAASFLIIIIKTIGEIRHGLDWKIVCIYEFIFLFGICCYCISILIGRHVGAGDLDIYFLIFLTQPIFAVVLMISSLVVFLKDRMMKPKQIKCIINNSDVAEHEQTIWKIKIPFVPFLLLGYILSIIISGVMI